MRSNNLIIYKFWLFRLYNFSINYSLNVFLFIYIPLSVFLFSIDFLIISNPLDAFNSEIVYEYLKVNYNNVNWQFIFNYDEFFKSSKMITLLEHIFNSNEFDSIEHNLWIELLKNHHSIEINELTNIICANKDYIDYFYLGNNYNIFTNNI